MADMKRREKKVRGLDDNWKNLQRVPERRKTDKSQSLLSRIAKAISAR